MLLAVLHVIDHDLYRVEMFGEFGSDRIVFDVCTQIFDRGADFFDCFAQCQRRRMRLCQDKAVVNERRK